MKPGKILIYLALILLVLWAFLQIRWLGYLTLISFFLAAILARFEQEKCENCEKYMRKKDLTAVTKRICKECLSKGKDVG